MPPASATNSAGSRRTPRSPNLVQPPSVPWHKPVKPIAATGLLAGSAPDGVAGVGVKEVKVLRINGEGATIPCLERGCRTDASGPFRGTGSLGRGGARGLLVHRGLGGHF